jgi:hypothetical protein
VVRWFDLTVGCLVVTGHGALCGSAMARPRSARVCGGKGSGKARRVGRREGLGLVALVLHQAERGADTRQRRGRASSMVEAL